MRRRPHAAAALVLAALLGPANPGAAPDGGAADALLLWVFLHADSARAAGPAALSPAALDRRTAHGIPILDGDRPVPGTLVNRVAATGARIRHTSRWLRAVSVETDQVGARRLAALPFVSAVAPVARLQPMAARAHDVGSTVPGGALATAPHGGALRAQEFDSAYFGPNWAALDRLGIPAAHASGFTGTGVRIAILDTGFEPQHRSLVGRPIFAARDFINDDETVEDQPGDAGREQEVHGTRVWSLLASFLPGTFVGVAPDAQFILAKVDEEPGDRGADEDRWVAAIEWADSLGARVVNSSVGFRFDFVDKAPYPLSLLDGDQTVTTRMADEAARRGILVVAAMGNDGPGVGTLVAPADGDSIIAVGAVDALGQAASFAGGASARGPTGDDRTKPELAAPGVGIVAAMSTDPDGYTGSLAGTSYATPFISGGAALVMTAWPDLGAMAVREALIQAAEQTVPDNAIGHGRPNIAGAIMLPRGITNLRAATVDLQGALTTIAPSFSWTTPLLASAMRPVRFRLEIARDPVFDDVIYSDTITDEFTLSVDRALRPAAALWWRVVAEGPRGVRRASPVASPLRMPRWVRLVNPAGDRVTFVNTQRPELIWAPLAAPAPVGPFTYDVEIFSVANGGLAQPAIRNISQANVRVPAPLTPNNAYRWRVIARTQAGVADTVESSSPFVVTSDTLPPATLLYQNFPNPFPRRDLGTVDTRIWFDLAAESVVELAVFDLRGRLVRRLVPGSPSCGTVTLEPGQYGRLAPGAQPDPCVLTTWNGRDENGELVPRGVYVLRLRADGKVEYRRIVFVRD